MTPVAKNIRRIREQRKITQEAMAEKLYVTRQAVSNWERGRSQPDMETLQRIAEVLEVEIVELIYGIKQSEILRKARKKWIYIGIAACAAVAAAALILIALIGNGTIGTWRYGISYQFWNNDYSVDYIRDTGEYSLEIDLTNPKSNEGKVLYEDPSTGCKIVVTRVLAEDDRHEIDFRAYGSYDRAGGTLVSACYPVFMDKTHYTLETSGTLTTTVGGRSYNGSIYLSSGLIHNDGNEFGFSLFPLEQYEHGALLIQDDIDAANGVVTITVGGLTELVSTRNSYWSLYG